MKPVPHWIDGRAHLTTQTLPVVDPATGEKIADLCEAGPREVELAVLAAKRAFPAWSQTQPETRRKLMLKLANLVEQHREELANLESRNSGKPLKLSLETEIPRAQANFEFFAQAPWALHGESFSDSAGMHWTERSPLGVVAVISPWNLPLLLFTWKVAPALICGNTVVAKPSEVTPLTAARLAELATQAGFPDGVFNVLHGRGSQMGDALVKHEDVKAVTFTGSTLTGSNIAHATAGTFKKISLEMGGKNPAIVFADCDLTKTIPQLIRASFQNQGQICLCSSRILVEKSLLPSFLENFVAQTQKLKLGSPLDLQTDQGPLVSESHMQKVLSHIDWAKKNGGNILCGGRRAERPGFFVEPTVITGLSMDCKTNQEEIFGPVVTVMPFTTESEAVELANQTPYGLSATVWTTDGSKAQRVARNLQTGMVWINSWMVRDLRTPFGGWKQSGFGREGGMDALRFFTEIKSIYSPLGG